MSARLVPAPGCGINGWWCHGSCLRHGRCMYVRAERASSPTINPDRAQLAALSSDPRATAHADRLDRARQDREARAANHFAD